MDGRFDVEVKNRTPRPTNDKLLSSVMVVYGLKGHGTQKKTNSNIWVLFSVNS